MKIKILIIGIGLIFFHLLTELHSLLNYKYPSVAQTQVDIFLSKTYKMLLAIQWYLKMSLDDLMVISTYFFFAWVANKYSRKLFFIISIWFFYHLLDLYMFWWNYKSTYWAYWSLLLIAVIQTIILLIPIKEKGRVVSME